MSDKDRPCQIFTDNQYFELVNPNTGRHYNHFFMVHPAMEGYRNAYIACVRQMVREANREGEVFPEVYGFEFDFVSDGSGYKKAVLKSLEERNELKRQRGWLNEEEDGV